jgi:nucleotide-binding universal stress UspA family protein
MGMLPFKRILCPTDFSESSYEALKAADELALHFSAELYLVHVVAPVPIAEAPTSFNVPSYQQELTQSAERSLQEVIEQRVAKELEVRPIVALGYAADEIARIAEAEQVDLIVTATHGTTGWRRFIFGSVAERVVRLASCPVLTVQAPHKEG